jgi:hypothetical protein
MKTADRVALRWASFQTSTQKKDQERGKILYEIKVNLGDMTKHSAELDAEAMYYTDSHLDDENLSEAFEELFFSQSNKKKLDSELHSVIRKLTDFELTAWLEDYWGVPKKMSELKNVTLTFVVGVAFEPPHTLEPEVENSLTKALSWIFK